MGKHESEEVKMGCWYQNTGMYNMTGLGFLGLGRGKSSVMSSLKESGAIESKSFSTCFSEKGGSMALGDNSSDSSDMKWVPATYSRSNWWKVEVTGVRMGEVKVGGKMSAWQEGKGTLVDTINTDTFIPAKLAPQFKEAFEKATGMEYIENFGPGQGYDLTEEQVKALPSLYFDLNGGDDRVGGTTIEVKPSAYTAKNSYKNGQYNYRLLLHAADPAGGVLGANTLRNHRVTFDDENSRIGWEATDCDKFSEEAEKSYQHPMALYKMDGPEYFTTIGEKFDVKDKKKFDPLSVTKMPKSTQNSCNGVDMGTDMDMGSSANWKDTIKCIPKGNVAHNGIAPVITPSARTALNNLFESRIATGSGKHDERAKDVKYKLFQVPIPDRHILDNAIFENLETVDSRQLTAPARMVVCHSVATSWVCHAPTATFFYSVKAKAQMKDGSDEIIDLAVMCHASSPEEPKEDGTICHITGAGDLAVYPEEIETGVSLIEQEKVGNTAAATVATVTISESKPVAVSSSDSELTYLLLIVVGWALASVAIAVGFYYGKSRNSNRRNSNFAAVPGAPQDELQTYI